LLQRARVNLVTFLASVLLLAVPLLTALVWYLYPRYEGKQISWAQSLLFVLETMSTTGYGHLGPITSWPLTLLAIFTMLLGVGTFFIVLGYLAGEWLRRNFQEIPPDRAPPGLKDHVIICTDSPLARTLAAELQDHRVAILLVDDRLERILDLGRQGIACMLGDPSDREVLNKAGLQRAQALVAAASDPKNSRILLAARSLGCSRLVAVVEEPHNSRYLRYAGAAAVVCPREALGEALARWILSRHPTALLSVSSQLGEVELAEVMVDPASRLVDRTLREARIRERTGVTVLGYWFGGIFHLATPRTRIRKHSVLTAIGTREQMDRFAELALNRQMPLRRAEVAKKVVIAGHGHVGRRTEQVLQAHGVQTLVVDIAPLPPGAGIRGDATDEDTLLRSGIKEAGVYVVALDHDARTIHSTLLAKQLNPSVEVAARANTQSSVRLLHEAGASYVVSLAEVGAKMVASAVRGTDPGWVAHQIEYREFPVARAMVGKALADCPITRDSGAIVLAVRRGQQITANPPPHWRFQSGDQVLVLGTQEQLESFRARYAQ